MTSASVDKGLLVSFLHSAGCAARRGVPGPHTLSVDLFEAWKTPLLSKQEQASGSEPPAGLRTQLDFEDLDSNGVYVYGIGKIHNWVFFLFYFSITVYS